MASTISDGRVVEVIELDEEVEPLPAPPVVDRADPLFPRTKTETLEPLTEKPSVTKRQ
jgi:hypothetical protein